MAKSQGSNSGGGSFTKSLLEALAAIGFQIAGTYVPKILEHIRSFWNQKTLAVIGPTASGKDSLIARLQGKLVPEEHINTTMPEPVNAYEVNFSIGLKETIKFKARKAMNVGGEEPDREEYWSQACDKADVIFYIIDAEKISHNRLPALSRLKSDMRWISAEVKNSGYRLLILINKIDLVVGSENIGESLSKSAEVIRPLIGDVKKTAQEALGTRKSHLIDVLPLCLNDNYLFSQLFPPILRAAAGK